MLAQESEAGGFFVVADIYVGFEGGFVAEKFVEIGFVGAEGDVHRRVEVHPGHVAFVIIVGREGVGARGEKVFQAVVVGERSCVAEKFSGEVQVCLDIPRCRGRFSTDGPDRGGLR